MRIIKALIDKCGTLHLYRGLSRGLIPQACPYTQNRYCGDECPLFNVVYESNVVASDCEGFEVVELCHRTYKFAEHEFDDNRYVEV